MDVYAQSAAGFQATLQALGVAVIIDGTPGKGVPSNAGEELELEGAGFNGETQKRLKVAISDFPNIGYENEVTFKGQEGWVVRQKEKGEILWDLVIVKED